MTALKIVIAYTGYDALTLPGDNKPPRISHVVCWAHARRRLFEIFKATKTPIAEEALRQIRALYAVEAAIHGSYQNDVARSARRSKPLLEALHAWMLAQQRRLSGKLVGEADLAGSTRNVVDAPRATKFSPWRK